MKISPGVLIIAMLFLSIWTYVPGANAQSAPSLAIQSYAGLSITGVVGRVYSIEYTAQLIETNTPGTWRCLEFLQLPASPFLWFDRSSDTTPRRFYRKVDFPSPTNLVFVPPGTFRMGSLTNEVDRWDAEGPQTAVTISRGFWMGIHEVTQAEYRDLVGNNPSAFQGNDGHPVEQVSWEEAVAYCAALTERERIAERIAVNCAYRLPTEAEWEYACRAWTSTRFSHGEDPAYTELSGYAWHWHNSDLTTHPVGLKSPNPWGLHDMHGNVWEWCQDGWSEQLPGGISMDPLTPISDSGRVLRGGGWSYEPRNCRSASRTRGSSDERYNAFGFRVVLVAGEP